MMTAVLLLLSLAHADTDRLFGNTGFGNGGNNDFSFGGSQPSQGNAFGGGFGGNSGGSGDNSRSAQQGSGADGGDIISFEEKEEAARETKRAKMQARLDAQQAQLKAEAVEQQAQQQILGVEKKEREVRAQQIAEEQREIEEQHRQSNSQREIEE